LSLKFQANIYSFGRVVTLLLGTTFHPDTVYIYIYTYIYNYSCRHMYIHEDHRQRSVLIFDINSLPGLSEPIQRGMINETLVKVLFITNNAELRLYVTCVKSVVVVNFIANWGLPSTCTKELKADYSVNYSWKYKQGDNYMTSNCI